MYLRSLVCLLCMFFFLTGLSDLSAASSRLSQVKSTITYNALVEEEFQAWQSDSFEGILHIPAGFALSIKFSVEMGSFALITSFEEASGLLLSVRGQDLFIKKVNNALLVSLKNSSEEKSWVELRTWIDMMVKVGFRYSKLEHSDNGPVLQLQGPK